MADTVGLSAGLEPESLTVHLTTGADFIYEWELVDEDGNDLNWPAGTTLSIKFDDDAGTTWNATITGNSAKWNVESAIADSVDDLTTARIRYVNGTTDLTYFLGAVARHG